MTPTCMEVYKSSICIVSPERHDSQIRRRVGMERNPFPRQQEAVQRRDGDPPSLLIWNPSLPTVNPSPPPGSSLHSDTMWGADRAGLLGPRGLQQGNFSHELPRYRQVHRNQREPSEPLGPATPSGTTSKLCRPVARKSKKWTSEALEDRRRVWTVQTGKTSTVWTSSQRLWPQTTAVRTAVSHHAPGRVTTMTSAGPQTQVHKPRSTTQVHKPRSTNPGPQTQVHKPKSTNPGPQTQVHKPRSTAEVGPIGLHTDQALSGDEVFVQTQRNCNSARDSASVWGSHTDHLQAQTPHSMNDLHLADQLNEFPQSSINQPTGGPSLCTTRPNPSPLYSGEREMFKRENRLILYTATIHHPLHLYHRAHPLHLYTSTILYTSTTTSYTAATNNDNRRFRLWF